MGKRQQFEPAEVVEEIGGEVAGGEFAESESSPAVAVLEAPAPRMPTFDVEWNGVKSRIHATDDRAAWAIFCDQQKVYPSPKAGKVYRDGVQVYPPAK